MVHKSDEANNCSTLSSNDHRKKKPVKVKTKSQYQSKRRRNHDSGYWRVVGLLLLSVIIRL